MELPRARGPLSALVNERLRGSSEAVSRAEVDVVEVVDVLSDDDFQLALWVLYELHYRGFEGVDPGLEWAPDLLAVRGALQERFEAALREVTGAPSLDEGEDFVDRLLEVIEDADGPSMSSYVHKEATVEQVREFLVQRSIYHLKESDPHSWAVPRLPDPVKAALVELQYDEYGAGRPQQVHATLYARGLAAMDLDAAYGAHLERVPGYTLAENNAMSLLGLHRRLRGAAMGHLAAFETTSSLPCRRYAMGLRRLELPEEIAHYFDEHIEADALHEQMAVRHICQRLVELEPELVDDVLFGAAVCVRMEALTSGAMLAAWERGESTLLSEPAKAAVA